jgi:hypothetical protein
VRLALLYVADPPSDTRGYRRAARVITYNKIQSHRRRIYVRNAREGGDANSADEHASSDGRIMATGAFFLGVFLAACGGETAPVVAPIASNAPADAASPAVTEEPSGAPPIPSAPSISGAPTDGGLCSEKCRGRATPDLVNQLTVRAQQTRRCYNRALGNDPKLRGEMRILVVVARDGSTCDPRVTGGTLPSEMTECVLNTFRGQSYSPPVDGCIEVTIPLRFEPAQFDGGSPVVP